MLYDVEPLEELSNLAKIFFIPLVVFFFIKVSRYYTPVVLYKFIVNYGFIISLIIIGTFILGIGNYKYGNGEYGFGMKGFFKAGNDLSLTLVVSLGISFVYYIKYSRKIFNLGKIFSIAISGVLVGSRVGMIIPSLYIICFVLYLTWISNKTHILLRMIIMISFPIFAIWFGTYIYSRLDKYSLNKFEQASIESARDPLTAPAKKHIESFDNLSLIIGNGSQILFHNVAQTVRDKNELERREVETDWYELIGSYGYGIGLVMILYYWYFIYVGGKACLKRKDIESFVIFFQLLLFVVIGYLAGHAAKNMLIAPIYGVMASMSIIHLKYSKGMKQSILVLNK